MTDVPPKPVERDDVPPGSKCCECGGTKNLEHTTPPGQYVCSGCIPF